MWKKTWLLGVLLALSAVSAYADTAMYWQQIAIRRAQSALIGGYVDSSFTAHTGAVTDTTAPFTLLGRTPFGVVADTSLGLVATVSITANATTVAAGSTVSITLQGTFDGATWVPAPAYVASELVAGAGLMEVKPYSFSSVFPVVAALTDNNMWIFPIYRLIFAHASGQTGTMAVRVEYPRSTSQPQ